MFVANTRGGYGRNGQQWARGAFLLVFDDREAPPIPLGRWTCAHCGQRATNPDVLGPCGNQYSLNHYVRQEENRELAESGDVSPAFREILLRRPPIPVTHNWKEDTAPMLLACVRTVHLRQLGHFMMGTATVGEHELTVSGPYGCDGLPMDLPENDDDDIRSHLTLVPTGLAIAFWNGGGHNCAGAEGPAMRAWARANLSTLCRKGRKGR